MRSLADFQPGVLVSITVASVRPLELEGEGEGEGDAREGEGEGEAGSGVRVLLLLICCLFFFFFFLFLVLMLLRWGGGGEGGGLRRQILGAGCLRHGWRLEGSAAAAGTARGITKRSDRMAPRTWEGGGGLGLGLGFGGGGAAGGGAAVEGAVKPLREWRRSSHEEEEEEAEEDLGAGREQSIGVSQSPVPVGGPVGTEDEH